MPHSISPQNYLNYQFLVTRWYRFGAVLKLSPVEPKFLFPGPDPGSTNVFLLPILWKTDKLH